MPSVSYIKDVSSGFGEYFSANDSFEVGEYVEFEFNREITIDDLILRFSSSDPDSGDKLQLYLLYPSSGMKGVIATFNGSGGGGEYYYNLNSTNDRSSTEGHIGTGRNWYQIPARSKLRIEAMNLVNFGTIDGVELTVIGRG